MSSTRVRRLESSTRCRRSVAGTPSRAAGGARVAGARARRRRVGAVVAFLVVAADAALGAGWWWTRRVIPQLDGRTPVGGLRAAVAVHFDRFAIPHIYAASEPDA